MNTVKLKKNARYLAKKHVPADGRTCERCGCRGPLERHHPDYSRPLFVELLCRPCHTQADKEMGLTGGRPKKLSLQEERAILLMLPWLSITRIAKRFSVSRQTVYNIQARHNSESAA